MKSAKTRTKKIVKSMAVKSAKAACGTASLHSFCQTKEPASLKKLLKK